MTFEVRQANEGKTLEIIVKGQFQFAGHREFRDAYVGFVEAGGHFRVKLAQTEYMDSAALGMLLLLNEHAKQHRQSITLVAPPPVIRRILDVACFDKLFHIED